MSIECNSCGAQIDGIAASCPYCQAAISQRIAPPPETPAQWGAAPSSLATAGDSAKPKGSVGVLIALLVLFWPGGLIYYLSKRWK